MAQPRFILKREVQGLPAGKVVYLSTTSNITAFVRVTPNPCGRGAWVNVEPSDLTLWPYDELDADDN